MTSILFALLSAVSWGSGDFFGGLASRKTGPFLAVLFGELTGSVFLFGTFIFYKEAIPTWNILLIAALAGALGSVGLIILYYAMAQGQMSIATPVSALMAAAIPVAVGSFLEGVPAATKIGGFFLAFLAVWLVAQERSNQTQLNRLADLRWPLFSGVCFGVYFILIHQASQTGIIWPMAAARVSGVLIIFLFLLFKKEKFQVKNNKTWYLIVLNGILDVGGNAFYILAGQTGRLDIAATISSLYPGMTVLLAWLVLKEQMNNIQKLGILSALVAIFFLTI